MGVAGTHDHSFGSTDICSMLVVVLVALKDGGVDVESGKNSSSLVTQTIRGNRIMECTNPNERFDHLARPPKLITRPDKPMDFFDRTLGGFKFVGQTGQYGYIRHQSISTGPDM